MTAKELGEQPAYPHLFAGCQRVNETEHYPGLTIRQAFAKAALQGLCVGCAGMLDTKFSAYAHGQCDAVLVDRAVWLADALLAALVASDGDRAND